MWGIGWQGKWLRFPMYQNHCFWGSVTRILVFRQLLVKITKSLLFREIKVLFLTVSFVNKNVLIWIDKREVRTEKEGVGVTFCNFRIWFLVIKQKKRMTLLDSGTHVLTALLTVPVFKSLFYCPRSLLWRAWSLKWERWVAV